LGEAYSKSVNWAEERSFKQWEEKTAEVSVEISIYALHMQLMQLFVLNPHTLYSARCARRWCSREKTFKSLVDY
jgi:hypothetical protein